MWESSWRCCRKIRAASQRRAEGTDDEEGDLAGRPQPPGGFRKCHGSHITGHVLMALQQEEVKGVGVITQLTPGP